MSSQPLRWPRRVESDYLLVVVRILSFVIRCIKNPPPDFQHTISADVKEHVEILLNALSSEPRAPTGPLVHSVLYSLFCHEHAEGGDRQNFDDPIARAIVLMSILPSGRWREADRVAPILARITWAIRVVAFVEIVVSTGDNASHVNLYEFVLSFLRCRNCPMT